jgi:4-hydroxy-2-oxoglutarate aldolase
VTSRLQGIIPPVATPFKDEVLDLAGFEANFGRWLATDLSGYLVLGSNGESVYLGDQERAQVIAAGREAVPRDKIFMIGAGAESTHLTKAQVRQAARLGADCVLVISPCYYKSQMTPPRLVDHFRRVADDSPVPVLIYNVPQATVINLAPETVARLAEHPNIAGIKDSSGNVAQLSEIIRLCPPDFRVFVGHAPTVYPALCLGAVGGILAVANAAPQPCLDLLAAVRRGDHPEALRLQRLITPLAEMVTSRWGVGGLKLAMNLAGYQGGQPRSPLILPVEPEIQAALEGELKKLGLA